MKFIFNRYRSFFLFAFLSICCSNLAISKNRLFDADQAKIDTIKSPQKKLQVLDSLIRTTPQGDIAKKLIYSSEYITLALNAERFDLATQKATRFYEILYKESYRIKNVPLFYKKGDSIYLEIEKYLTEISDINIVGELYLQRGIQKSYEDKLDLANTYLTRASRLEKLKDSSIIVTAIYERGINFSALGLFKKALDDYTFAQQYYRRINDMDGVFATQKSLVTLYGYLGFEKQAIKERKKYIEEKIKTGRTQDLCYDYFNLSVSYRDDGDLVNAEKYMLKARELALEQKQKDPSFGIDFVNLPLSVYYSKLNESEKAKKYLTDLQNELKGADENSFTYMQVKFGEAFYYLSTGELKKAENAAVLVYDFMKNAQYGQESTLEILDLLYRIYSAKNEAKASLTYYEKYNKIKDSLFNIKKINSLAYYQTIYDTEKKEKDLLAQELIISNQNKQRTYLIIGVSALLILSIGLYFFLRKIILQRNIIKLEQNKVSKSLLEKELLLKEIHHRVKNNMQIVSGLIHKQARVSGNIEFKELMNAAKTRIKSMAIVHENLYSNNDFSEVDLKTYVVELAKNIDATYRSEKTSVELNVDMEVTKFDMNLAIPLGLIFNELLTNIYKYAFKGGIGVININLASYKDKSYKLKVKDNGIGLPEDFDKKSENSLGMNLIKGLCNQIDATLSYTTNKGSEFNIVFQK